MASAFAHGMVAAALLRAGLTRPLPGYIWALALFSSILPDIDVLGFFNGVEYAHRWGHRGMTHSLWFAALWSAGLVLMLCVMPRWRSYWLVLFLSFFLVTASHAVLDALTNGGLGVGFFLPWDEARYFFPWRPLAVSPLGVRGFLSERGVHILLNELMYLGPVSLALLLFGQVRRYFQRRQRQGNLVSVEEHGD